MDKAVLYGRLRTQMVGTDEQIWRFTMMSYQDRKKCKALQRSLAELHKVHGGRHVKRGWAVTEKVKKERWVFIHTMAMELYFIGNTITHYKGLKEKHVIGLCRFWESEGLAPSTLLYKKSMLKTVLIWAGKDRRMYEGLTNEQLFANPQALENVAVVEEEQIELAPEDKQWQLEPLRDIPAQLNALLEQTYVLSKLAGLKARRFIMLSGMLYWFDITTREAARFVYATDYVVGSDSMRAHIVVKRQDKEKQRFDKVKVFIKNSQQLEFLDQVKELFPVTKQLIPNADATFKEWTKVYKQFAKDNGISSKELRLELAKEREHELLEMKLKQLKQQKVA